MSRIALPIATNRPIGAGEHHSPPLSCGTARRAVGRASARLLHRQPPQRFSSPPQAVVSADGDTTASTMQPPLCSSEAGITAGLPRSTAAGAFDAATFEPADRARWKRPYPFIDQQFPGLERIHEEPPVYIAHGFLSAQDCQLLRQSAEAGQLQGLAYDNAVLLDMHRLWPLLLIVAAGAGFDCWRALADASLLGALTPESLAAAAAPALLRWGAGVGCLLGAAWAAASWLVGGRVFTGTKWTAAAVDPSHPTAPALARFLARTTALLDVPAARLEPPTVTRYRKGQYQRIHFDARPEGDPAGLKQFLEAGGQRLVQVVAYLNTLGPDQGGGTIFHHPTFRGLTVQPEEGDALIFFPAFANGRFDERMAHAGLAVQSGEKWILNTWACQHAVPTAVTHLPPLCEGLHEGR